jgi:hypothetical protein
MSETGLSQLLIEEFITGSNRLKICLPENEKTGICLPLFRDRPDQPAR